MIPSVSFAPECFEALPEPPAGMLVYQGVDALNDLSITIVPLRDLVVGRPRQTNAATTALYGQTMLRN